MKRTIMRSPLGQASGLGMARHGVEHWWRLRVTAIALVPLTVWFVTSALVHTGSDYSAVIAWLRTPLVTWLVLLTLIALFAHTALGLQVVIEDYMHSGAKFVVLIAMQLSCFGLAVVGIAALLRIALGG